MCQFEKMRQAQNILTLENRLFQEYLFYMSLLSIKMLTMSLLTSRQRLKHKAFANPEDVGKISKKMTTKTHEDVERVRRAHLNDLENILLFFAVSFGYLWTNPSPFVAIWLFRFYTATRFAHTLVYAVFVIRQPARFLFWSIGYFITGYMAVRIVLSFV